MAISSIIGNIGPIAINLQLTNTVDATPVTTAPVITAPVPVALPTTAKTPSGFQLTAAELLALPDGANIDLVGADGTQRRLLLDSDLIYTQANKGIDANSALIMAPLAGMMGHHDPSQSVNYYSAPATEALTVSYADQSDTVLMMANPVLEAGGAGSDQHALTIDKVNGFIIDADTYVDTPATQTTPAVKTALAIAAYDLIQPRGLRPNLDTSEDAAGLPMAAFILTGAELVRAQKNNTAICHPLRFTIPQSFFTRLFRHPGTHYATRNTVANGFPYAGIIRLKSSVDLTQFSPQFQPIAKCLATWGAIAADNSGASYAFFQMDTNPLWEVPFTFDGNTAYYYNDDFHKLNIGTMFDLVDSGPSYGDAPNADSSQLPVISGSNPYTLTNATGAYIVDGLPLHLSEQPFTLKSGQTLTCYNNNPVSRVSVTAP